MRSLLYKKHRNAQAKKCVQKWRFPRFAIKKKRVFKQAKLDKKPSKSSPRSMPQSFVKKTIKNKKTTYSRLKAI